VIIETKKNTS